MDAPLDHLLLPSSTSGGATTLAKLSSSNEVDKGVFVVVDLWTVSCGNCPRALAHLNAFAGKVKEEGVGGREVKCVSICLEQSSDDRALAQELLEGAWWNDVTHYYASGETRDSLRALLGFKFVPYYVVVSDGFVAYSGRAINDIKGTLEELSSLKNT